ncbi:MAG: hypothetical protein K9G39_01215 [Chlorobium sp.]|uniref:hypothetical protein n=1 Tax=Chlorobium sp. TaxID=1095 RepID=UPI0025C65F83|nr:hypothetical protein [Chlorobium sp.]MCF8382204.1 hypothetical protein [Chlorobium sp.]
MKESDVSLQSENRMSVPEREPFGAINTGSAGEAESGLDGTGAKKNLFAESGDGPFSESEPVSPGRGGENFRDLFARAFEFRFSDLLRLRTFLYLLPVTGILLFQTYNTIAIKKLALANETLRERIAMSSSVITSQELKVNELQGIHNIALLAERLGLQASSVPAIEIVP